MFYSAYFLFSLCADILALLTSNHTTNTRALLRDPDRASTLNLLTTNTTMLPPSSSSSSPSSIAAGSHRQTPQFVAGQDLVYASGPNLEFDGKLKVRVYYETLCGDSKRFIRSQLYPLVIEQGGHKHMDVELIPYGKATTFSAGGRYSFTCQHREAECEGNRMHSCALKYIQDRKQQVEFVACSMSTSYPPRSLPQCSAQLRLTPTIEDAIKTCSESIEGDKLLAANGVLTDELSPKLFFVPTVTYNGVFDEDKMWESLGSFKTVACEKLKNARTRVDFCARQSREYRGNRRAGRSFRPDLNNLF